MKADSWSTLVAQYSAALATHAAGHAEHHLQVAYDLGRRALQRECGVLDMVRLHQEAIARLAHEVRAGRIPPLQPAAVEAFLMEALSPFEAAHRGFRDTCRRLNPLNATLRQRNRQLALTNRRLTREIVGRKVAQREAEESESKFRSVVESARDGIVTVAANGRIAALNRGAEEMFGYPRRELLRKAFTCLLPARRRALARHQLHRLVTGNGKGLLARTLETCGRHRDGTEFPVELSVAAWHTAEGPCFTGIVRDISDRKQAEKALRESREHYIRLLEEARAMERNLRQLSNQVLTAQEEERKHISRELHDEIGQTLTAANVSVALLRKHAQADPEMAGKVEGAQRLLERCMDMVHRFAGELRPSLLDHLGPVAALQSYVKTYRERTDLAVDLEGAPDLENLDPQIGTVLYRVAQECLARIYKHAQATRVKIRLNRDRQGVVLEIADNGRSTSFLPGTADGRAEHWLGVVAMQERVRLVRGQLTIDPAPRRGTTVRVQIPVAADTAADAAGAPLSVTDPVGPIQPTSHEQNQCTPCR